MINYQLYLEKARYQSPNNERLLNEALETFFESREDFKEAEAIAFLGMITTIGTVIGLPILLIMSLAFNGLSNVIGKKIKDFKNVKPEEHTIIKQNAPKVLEIIEKNNFKVNQKDIKKFKEKYDLK